MYRRASGISLIVILLASVLAAPPVVAQNGPRSPRQLRNAINDVLDDDRFENAAWSLLIKDLRKGDVLFALNEKRSYIPASNTKLYTTSAALDLLGPEFVYETSLFVDGPVEDGTLRGNVVVLGSGDPVIGGRFNDGDLTEVFRSWADSLKAKGIQNIAGSIVGDDDAFDDVSLGYGWSWDDETFWYSAEVGALSFNDNCIDFSIQSQLPGMPGLITWEPAQTTYPQVVNATITIDADSSLNEGYFRERGSNAYRLYSEVPSGRIDKESLSVRNPTRYFVHVLRETLLESGISVTGDPIDVDDIPFKPDYDAPKMVRVATHRSRPLKDIVQVLNKRSHNLYAEQVLRTLGVVYPVDDPEFTAGSAAMGIERAMDTFIAAQIDTSRIQLVDGSGLSRMNLVTAEMTSSLLGYMFSHPDDSTRAAFLRSLPIGGVDGTLEFRFTDSPAQGKVRAKTGTVSNVSSLSGFVTSAVHTPLSFVLMANHFTVKTSEIRDAQDRIVELLATYGR